MNAWVDHLSCLDNRDTNAIKLKGNRFAWIKLDEPIESIESRCPEIFSKMTTSISIINQHRELKHKPPQIGFIGW